MTHPPHDWGLGDLEDLGEKAKTYYLKAVPVLILEKWVKKDREEGVANWVRTRELAPRLVDSGLHEPFPKKGDSNVLGALRLMQSQRNLVRPPLITKEKGGWYSITLPRYEPLLQAYRQWYSEQHKEDYKKLFPQGEPEWEPPPTREGSEEKPSHVQAQSFSESILQVAQKYEEQWRENLQGLETRVRQLQQENEKMRGQLDKPPPIPDEITDSILKKRLSSLGSAPFDIMVRESGVVLEERLRAASGCSHQLYGVDLVEAALSVDRGVLVFSAHTGEQDGVKNLYKGAYQFIRNPVMHRLIEYREDTARLLIRLTDSLLQLLAEAKRK